MRPLIRVVNDIAWPALADGHLQRIQDELGAQVVGSGPADDLAAPEIEYHGEIEEAGCRGDERVSRPEELHLRPLSEPDVNLSAHPAPIIQPMTDSPSTNERTSPAAFAPFA